MTRLQFDKGLCTSRDRSDLPDGYLQTATGLTYKPGDPVRCHKVSGRTSYGSVGTGLVKSLALCQFDSGTDKLLAYTGTTISGATPGASGTFVSLGGLAASLNASATRMSVAHAYDKFFIANGYDRNIVLKSDGTVRRMSMLPPPEKPVCVASSATVLAAAKPTTQVNPSSSQTAFTSPANAYDLTFGKNLGTASYVATAAPGVFECTWHGWASYAVGTRKLSVTWVLSPPFVNIGFPGWGTGGTSNTGAVVSVLITYCTDWNGSTGTFNKTLASYPNMSTDQSVITSSDSVTVNNNLIAVRARYTYTSGSTQPIFKIYDIRMETATTTAFSTTTGLYYAITEWDGTNLIESGPSEPSDLLTMTTQNLVTVTLPSAAQNATTTHWRIYRTFDGGAVLKDLFVIDEVPVATTSYVDSFVVYDKDAVGTLLIPLVSVTIDSGTVRVPRDSPAPAFAHMSFFKGSVVGVSRTQPRVLYYSFAGRPESWPAIYSIDTLPFQEHDGLVATATAGDSLIIGAQNSMMVIDDLPRTVQGVFSAVDARPLKGQPGLVNQDAICSYSVSGEPRVAWVSKYGLHWTNGTNSGRISLAIDWNGTTGLGGSQVSTAMLFYDTRIQCLILAYDSDSDGLNDRWFQIHMAPEHQLEDGQPKWTGPHYGVFNCMAAGNIAGTYRRWSGHTTDASVYNEGIAGTDASNAYAAVPGFVPFIAKTARLYGPMKEWGVFKANLRHTAWGAAQTMSVVWLTGRDQNATTQTYTKTHSLVLNQGNEFFVGLQGEWHEIELTHTGSGSGALLGLEFTPIGGERPGTSL